MTATMLERETTLDPMLTDDPGNATHIVYVPDPNVSPQAYVLAARIEGFPVTAMCGYTWIPFKDPASYPVCEKCLEEYHAPGENREDREQMPDA